MVSVTLEGVHRWLKYLIRSKVLKSNEEALLALLRSTCIPSDE